MGKTKDFKVDIGQKFKDDKRDLIIIDRVTVPYNMRNNITTYKSNHKQYQYKCNKCGNVDWIEEGNLLKGIGCGVCCSTHRITKKGYNDIATTDPWMCEYIVNEEDWYNYTCRSSKKILMKCPFCGKIKEYKINALYTYGKLSCECGDEKPYPEKFMFNIFTQLNIECVTQYKIDKKRYDFYFIKDEVEYIIETHGIQYYEESFKNITPRSLKKEQENDEYKYKLAIQNGIRPENYIVIDFRYSTLEWGKEHILNSRLGEIFDLSGIDWLQCEGYALKNIVKEVCNYWYKYVELENKNITFKELSNKFGVKINTIQKYLQKGENLGWCNYKDYINKGYEIGARTCKRVKVFKDNILLGEYESAYYIAKHSEELFKIKLQHTHICKVCRGELKHHKGYYFEYS